MCKIHKAPYPLWQYPIIFSFLFDYLIKIRFKIRAVISWRREIGVISKEHKVTFSDIMSFGHWAVGETMNGWWNPPRLK